MRFAGALLLALLASCGGGGGTSSPTSSPSLPSVAANITGYVVEGPVSGSTVKLYRVDVSGTKTLLGTAVTDSRGFYAIANTAPANTSVLVEASGGTYADDMSGQSMTLSVPMRAATTWSGSTATVSVTPYSEVAVRILEHATTQDWSANGISAANKKIADNLGASTLLDFIPVDLLSPPAPGARDNDISLSFYTSGFSGFAHRVDANPSTSLGSALTGMYQLMVVDENDDKLAPAFVGGVIDIVEKSATPLSSKQQLSRLLLLGSETNLYVSDAQLDLRRPRGVSSGGASAAMPNDAFRLVGNRLAGSMFNSRGALIAYPLEYLSGSMWRTLYTASAAEVFGDGDVGIGRWNGGATIDSTRAGAELTQAAPSEPILSGSLHYALARPATALPGCGMRRLPLVAATLPTQFSIETGMQPLVAALTSDSTVGVQYGADPLVGFDIGVRGTDGVVTRYRSLGGADSPWASGITLGTLALSPVLLQPGTPGTALSGFGMEVQGLLSGNGGTKLAVKLNVGGQSAAHTDVVAAFVAAVGGVDSSGCAAAVGDPGTAINPPPASGYYKVLLGMANNVPGPGVGTSTFRARGELSTTSNLQVGAATPVYELAGSANASIGRIDGPFTLAGTSYNRSLPYAVASRNPVLPPTGTRHFVLVASTLVVPELDGVPGGELAPGTVQSASLDINFNEFPIGSPNSTFGTASISVTGSVGGVPFSIGVPGANGVTPSRLRFNGWNGEFTDDFGVYGVLAAPSGNDAVVQFKVMFGYRPATGTLLFRAQ
jgi:hypothetical protein